ncbi:Endoplasmic oxidoreductin-1 [Aphelenchoides besseyi]|nr:Endoplasmic oxidoreductin-1 [Aphelenchoides besseyi]KAI6208346.1 Endoplasmic oxidoreductin-1 [Aphelenchoides besseyi]
MRVSSWAPYSNLDLWIILLVCVSNVNAQFASHERAWFCKDSEAVQPCADSPSSIDRFNNEKVYPILQKLLQKDFFKFYKVNMEKPCPFWPEERECASKECGVEHCDDEVPIGLRKAKIVLSVVRSTPSAVADKNGTFNNTAQSVLVTNTLNHHSNDLSTTCTSVSSSKSCTAQVDDKKTTNKEKKCETGNQFDPLDRSLTEGDVAQLADMESFEDSSDRFCDFEDDTSSDLHYVNLYKNPERYTGYKGNSALKVWQSIYQENCFKPDPRFDKDFLLHPSGNTGMCLEKRVFYRLISGLHSAITVSIAAHNYKPAVGAFGEGTWFRNTEMFKGRFGTKWSWEGPERLMNLYFVYLFELRALVKIAPYLEKELFYTGNEIEDAETRQAVEQLVEICKAYSNHYDETTLFTGPDSQARLLREEFRQHFMNISRIMDCVDCDKCRLWGKLQTHGMGTALKILFSDLPQSQYRSGSLELPFKLTRNEVVALIQSFGRYSSSIYEVEEFRRIMLPELPSDLHSEL